MIWGIGFDIVELNRIEKILNRWGDRFIDRILTEYEKQYLPKNIIPYLGSRFAAKEAFVKALGTGFSEGISFKDIEIVKIDLASPQIKLYNNALKITKQREIKNILLSISHEKNVAGAVVVLEG